MHNHYYGGLSRYALFGAGGRGHHLAVSSFTPVPVTCFRALGNVGTISTHSRMLPIYLRSGGFRGRSDYWNMLKIVPSDERTFDTPVVVSLIELSALATWPVGWVVCWVVWTGCCVACVVWVV